jgi:hypothetical protein
LRLPAAILVLSILVIGILAGVGPAIADPLQNAAKQRIGNYDFQMTSEPKNPSAGVPTLILLRIAGVNGDDLVDVPLVIRIAKDGAELQRTNPIIVPYGHYTYEYTFAEPGRYALYIDLKDYAYSGETLTFTFLINVVGPADYLYTVLPAAAGTTAAAVAAISFLKKKKRRMENMK